MSNLAVRITFIAGLTASLVLTGCGGSKPTGHAQAPPKNTTNQASKETDPVVLAHMNARKQVDPTDLYGPHSYTTTPTAEEIDKDTNIRVVRLENQLADLQSDFKKLQPNLSPEAAKALEVEAKQTLAQVEMEKQLLMTQAQAQAEAAEQIIEPGAAPAPEVIAPAAGNAMAAISDVTGVRIGEHPDKARIVLDVTGPAKFSYNIDNAQNLLVIDLPESSWSGAVQETLATSSMVKGYTARPSASGGMAVTIELKRPAKLTMGSILEPNEVYGHRMVFDVAPL